jgi:nonsense-mediated mRNA decay protein 3
MFSETSVKIMCCVCGASIDPNPSCMCESCLSKNYSLKDKIPQTITVYFCRGCERYQQAYNRWVYAPQDSPELMEFCLSRITNLKDFKVVDSKFLFTEAHAKRIPVSLTLEFETAEKLVIRQTVNVRYSVQPQQCPDCLEASTPRAHWNSNVQLRQGGVSRSTLFWLEQQILTSKSHVGCNGIIRVGDGLDFQFQDKPSAGKLVSFIKSKLPVLTKESGKLISENFQSMTADVRFSFLVRIPPFSRGDFVILPPEIVKANGNRSFVALVHWLGKNIRLVDPFAGRFIDIDTTTFWKRPFEPIFTRRDLRRFVVLNIEHIDLGDRDCRFKMADVEITDEETYDDRIVVRTHLGDKLHEGNVLLCYDRRVSCLPETVDEIFKKRDVPDIIIVGRVTEKKRKFTVKELVPINAGDEDEFKAFIEELVDDPELRNDVVLYKDGTDEIATEEDILKAVEE